MSTRNDFLNSLKTTVGNITTTNGFTNTVKKVERRFVPYDQVFEFPTLCVLGGDEIFEDIMGGYARSNPFNIRILGYAKSVSEPEVAQCSLIADVLKVIDSATYNSNKSKMRPKGLETDEGMIYALSEGVTLFVLTIESFMKFQWSNP